MPSFSENNEEKQKHTERFGQILIYLGKLFRIFINENSWKLFPMAAIVSLIVASVCNNVFVNMEGTQVGALAFACVCIWNGFFNSIQSICKERPIIKREHRAGMHISSISSSLCLLSPMPQTCWHLWYPASLRQPLPQ